MSDAIVAKVGVEVFPIATTFSRKLRDDLVPQAGRIGEEVGRVLADKLQAALGQARVKVDTTTARTDIDSLAQRIAALGRGANPSIRVNTNAARADVQKLQQQIAAIRADLAVKVKADTAGFDTRIAEIKAELAAIADKRLAVQLDTANADAKLLSLNAEAGKLKEDLKSNADIDVEAAKARLEEIKAEIQSIREAKAQVKVDTAEANAKVAALKDELDRVTGFKRVKVDADTAEAEAKIAALRAELANLGSAGGNSSGGGGGGLGKALGLSFLPALIPAAAAAIPVVGGVASALVGAVAGGGALKAAFTGIGDAVTALGAKTGQSGQQLKQQAAQQLSAANGILNAQDAVANSVRALQNAQKQAGQQAIQSAESVRNAEQSLADARRSAATSVVSAEQAVADARRSAALSVQNAQQGVASAEQSYTSSLYSEQQAQAALNQARKQAAQTLQDLSNSVKDGALNQRQATIDLQNALDNLKVVNFNPHSTATQRAEAQLQVDQAKQHLSELELANSRLAAQKAAADKQGVAGATAVVSAEHAAAAATQSRQNAAESLVRAQAAVVEAQRAGSEQIAKAVAAETEARRAGAEQIAKAQQGVSDAIRQQAQQADSSQQAILSAQQGIVSSQRALAQAYASAGAQGSSANDKVAESMAALTPAGQRFARFVNDKLKPALKTLTDSAQQNFLPGFQSAIQTLLPFMPGFAKFVGAIARELGNMAQAAANGLNSPFWKQFGSFLGDMAKSALPILGTILGNFATGFAGLFEAIAPAGNGLGGGLTSISKAFADWATHLGTNKGFQAFLQYVKDNAPQIGHFLADIAVIVGKLVAGLAPMGATQAGLLVKVAGMLAGLSPSQLAAVATSIGAIVLVVKAAAVATDLWTAATKAWTLATKIQVAVTKALEGAQLALSFVTDMALGPVLALVAAIALIAAGLVYAYFHFKTFHDIVNTVAHAVGAVFVWLWNSVVKPVFGWIADHWHYVVTAMKAAWDDILHPVFDGLAAAVRWVWEKVVDPVFTYIKDHWHDVTSAMNITYTKVLKPVWDAMTKAFGDVKGAFGAFRDGLSSVWGEIKTIFIGGVNFITQNILNKLIDAVNTVTHVFGIPKIDHIPAISNDTSVATGANSTGQAHQGPGGRVPTKAAHGLVVPGYAPGVDNFAAILSPGEGVLVPEAVRGLGGPDFVHAANRHFSNRLPGSDNRHFFGGGVVGDVASAAGAGFKAAASTATHLAESAATLGPRLALDAAELPLKAVMGHLAPAIVKTLAQGAFGFIDKAVRAFIGGHPGGGSNISPAAAGAAGGAARWAPVVNQVLAMLGIPGSALNGILSLINHESGGNPNAINLTDSNARAGHPSQGLMQTIPTTFAAYAGPFLSRGITDPLANVYAGTNYAMHNYGVAMLAAGGRHDANGNYIGYDNGGFLQPGITQVYNGTGKPEPVFSDEQWATLSSARGRESGRPPIQQTNHFYEQTDPQQAAAESARRLHLASLI